MDSESLNNGTIMKSILLFRGCPDICMFLSLPRDSSETFQSSQLPLAGMKHVCQASHEINYAFKYPLRFYNHGVNK